MKPCIEYLELMNAVLDGEATPVQHEALSAHLAQCPACAALYEDLRAIRSGSAVLVTKAPETLKSNVMSRIAAERKGSNVVAFTPKAKKKSASRWRSWAAMAAVFALVIGVGTGRDLFSNSSSAPAPGAAPAAAEPSAVAQGIADIARSGDTDAAKSSTLTGHYEYSSNYGTTDPLADQVTAEAAPSVGPAEAAVSHAPADPAPSPDVTQLDIDWMKHLDLVMQRICGESGYTLETEYVLWMSSLSPHCIFRLLDGETVIDEGIVFYDGLSENGKFHCFSWTWEDQSEEDTLLFRYAVPLDMSYVMWAGDTFDMANYDNALKN